MVAVPATTRFCWTYVAQMTLLQPSVGLPDFWAGSGFEDNMLVASGMAKTFAEYDRYGLPIAAYAMEAEKYIYRVYKYEL